MSEKSAIHELIHRTLPPLRDLMNALAKAPQDNDLCLSSSLLLPGLQLDELDGVQVNSQKGIVDRSRQFSCIPRLIPQKLVEGS